MFYIVAQNGSRHLFRKSSTVSFTQSGTVILYNGKHKPVEIGFYTNEDRAITVACELVATFSDYKRGKRRTNKFTLPQH